MIALILAAAASTLGFDCAVDPPRNVIPNGASVTSQTIHLPPEMNHWQFGVTIVDLKKSTEVKLDWPGDPIGAGQALAALPVGPHDYSFVSMHQSPCLFTAGACMFLYTLSEQADGTADILIQPAALATDGDRSKPFQVYMSGRCTPKAVAR
ncbi:hypothetical protein HMF7854_08985 [Sphingomonas ginkgonis]|uniref:Uncharacterized protein n=1 Tax=Sphingomonas ginkgonis TaxID=2315330 RepID=A0A429VAH8_9SPHN|nr:hypothetical protein [Sphingomonas ginkgonis]RST30954.1 hypothetical protein HMF7854_08985 [Sphingomonas ginkgonis]